MPKSAILTQHCTVAALLLSVLQIWVLGWLEFCWHGPAPRMCRKSAGGVLQWREGGFVDGPALERERTWPLGCILTLTPGLGGSNPGHSWLFGLAPAILLAEIQAAP